MSERAVSASEAARQEPADRDTTEPGAEIDEVVVGKNRYLTDHRENLVDAAWKIRDGVAREIRFVGRRRVELEQRIDPRVAVARGHGE